MGVEVVSARRWRVWAHAAYKESYCTVAWRAEVEHCLPQAAVDLVANNLKCSANCPEQGMLPAGLCGEEAWSPGFMVT